MNPAGIAVEVEQRYRRYLSTMFYFRDPDLRDSFNDALASGSLAKGPYVEATPAFRRGVTLPELLSDLGLPTGSPEFLAAVSADRRLYVHQEAAIRAALQKRNVVLATGTGSGKTEAFLLPILVRLYAEHASGRLGPGVRALVLYPMNALVNDQRERLAKIAQQLKNERSGFSFTFGQYTGETPENRSDSRRGARARLEKRPPGELVLREEMRATPPHILLTNYAMLEYLLLRPADSPFFDDGRGSTWSFLVLDEAHQYRGSRGTEMGMLLRRLKQRIAEGGCEDRLQCIATSATLAKGEAERPTVARFAADLFGEPFGAADVILQQTEDIPDPGTLCLGPEDYQALRQPLSQASGLPAELLARANGLSSDDGEELNGEHLAARVLLADTRASRLRRRITGNPIPIDVLADEIFADVPPKVRAPALTCLVELLSRYQEPRSWSPIMSARYHLFLKSLEGAFLTYLPRKRVQLDRGTESDQVSFELAVCRECGEHYLVGRVEGGHFREADRDRASPNFAVTYLREVDEVYAGESPPESKALKHLCVTCGAISGSAQKPTCAHHTTILVEVQPRHPDQDRADQLPRCSACGYDAGGKDPVREVIYGADGPHAVVTTALYQHLDPGHKKILAFADSRQEAAFFAWYLEDSYRSLINRHLILKVVQELAASSPEEGLSLAEVADGLVPVLRSSGVVPPSAGHLAAQKEAWAMLYSELLTKERRLSLEGVGLLRYELKRPDWQRPSTSANYRSELVGENWWAYVWLILDSLRNDDAVELRTPPGVRFAYGDLATQGSEGAVVFDEIGKVPGNCTRWIGPRNRRMDRTQKLIRRLGPATGSVEDEARQLLRALWDDLVTNDKQAPQAQDSLLVPARDGIRLNPEWIRVKPVMPTRSDEVIYECSLCRQLHGNNVKSVCARFGCQGDLAAVRPGELPANHYRALYQEPLDPALRVEEHTAQLDSDKAREYQADFQQGKIQVLSCSTTFELGVDLGDLDVILLRNVPPEHFNYVQRVGRAGRRTGRPGFAVTYCRRSPHDLFHFAIPEGMMAGQIRAPLLSLSNERIVARHLVAVVLAEWFRHDTARFASVKGFLGSMERPDAVDSLRSFLTREKSSLQRALISIAPSPLWQILGLADGMWPQVLFGDDPPGRPTGARLWSAQAEAASDWAAVVRLERERAAAHDYPTAGWAKRRAATIEGEDVLSWLSRKAVIPKYGFPVDVVELDTHMGQAERPYGISLERDLTMAIAEYAPTAQVVANKRIWTSYALKRVPAREWPRRYYRRSAADNVFVQWEKGQPEPPTPNAVDAVRREYVVPAFGFTTARGPGLPLTARPLRLFSTRPYLAEVPLSTRSSLSYPEDESVVLVERASAGKMVVVCEGRRGAGFWVCPECGAGFRDLQRRHKTPFGQECGGRLDHVSLGHEFVTDVLQLHFLADPPNTTQPQWFAHALGAAVLAGACEVLEIPDDELAYTVSQSLGHVIGIPPIVLYDNVPGGAGLVARLEDEKTLRDALSSACDRVQGQCGCGPDTSCYGCLRTYRNQFAHRHLQRGPVYDYLRGLLAEWPDR